MIAGPVLSPCSFHSSWSCAALRQGHPASRDQLTDQEQCEAAKRITTRAKILSSGSRRVRKSCPLTAPKPSAKNAVDSRVAKVGLPSSRTGVGINVHKQDVENNCWRRCKTMGTQWPAVCKTSVAYLRKQSKLALLFARRQKFCRQTAPVLGSRNGPQNGGQVVRTQANQIETE